MAGSTIYSKAETKVDDPHVSTTYPSPKVPSRRYGNMSCRRLTNAMEVVVPQAESVGLMCAGLKVAFAGSRGMSFPPLVRSTDVEGLC